MAAEPTFSMNVTTIRSRAWTLRHTSANAWNGFSVTRPWKSARSLSSGTEPRSAAVITAEARIARVKVTSRTAASPTSSALMSACMLPSARIEPMVNAACRIPNSRLRSW